MENTISNNNSVFVVSALKCMYVFPFIWRKIPRLEALTLGNTGCLVSMKLFNFFPATECHFPSGLKFRVPHQLHLISRSDKCPVTRGNRCANDFTCSELLIHISSIPLFSHSMSLNIDMNMILPENRSGSTFWHCKSFWISCKICNVENPGKTFHSNSIASKSIPRNSSTA